MPVNATSMPGESTTMVIQDRPWITEALSVSKCDIVSVVLCAIMFVHIL